VPKSLPTISPPALELVAVLGGAGLAPDGYALFIEPPSHEDLFGLIRQSTLRVVGVYRDPKQAAEAREALRKVGLVGARGTAIAQPETWNALPAQAFNLVLAYAHPQADPPPIESWKLLLQPYNGIMAIVGARNAKLIDGAEVKRIETKLPAGGEASMNIWRAKPAAGLGEWSHPYADPGNSACSGDAVVKGPFEIAWFGPPGPENMVDRHNRTSPPLFRAGRLFVPGLDRITAVDAFNGTVLWQRPLPGATRLAVSKNTGHVVAGPKEVFVVRQAECVALDAATGKVVRTLRVPAPVAADKEWGYLALCDDVLLGSVSQSEESRRKLTQTSWEQGYLDHQPLVVSERLFALRPNSGSTAWQYQPKGAVVNTAVAAGDGHVYFVESADPATLKNSGRVHLGKLLEKGAHLVALRLDTGHEAWRVPLELKTRHILFLTLAGKKLVLAGSHNEGADLVSDVQAHDSADGRKLWALAQSTGMKVGGSHGEQEQHPLVVGDTLFFKTFSCDLARGSVRKNWKLPVVGCGALSASLHSAFYRAGTACYAELGESVNQQLTGVTRPGCWLNMLPTGGLVLAPESSAGCTCAQYSVQTSLALRPLAAPPPDVLAGFGTGAMERLQGDIEYAGRLRVALAAPQPADRIVYSLDGTWPGKQSASYDKPLTVDRPATLFARTYRGDQPGGITRRNLRCVTVPRLTGLTTTIVTSAKLEFARYPGEAVIRYQLDGKSPTTQSPTYDKLVTLTETTQVRAAYFDGDTKLGEDLAVEFRKVPGRKPDTPAAVQPGLAYEYFEVDGLKKLPDMDRLKPVRTGVTDRLAIPAPHRADNFAVRFRGYLEIAADGLYSFRLISDDGSEVCIGDEVLISHDGVHDARSERRATIPLAAGKHRIEIRYFEGDGNELLLVRYGLPGADKNELPAGALWHEANPR
jgi:outer membrane protein assembly factor BamB